MRRDEHIVILGQMGVGKTTFGAMVATSLGRPFHDSDVILVSETGRTAREIAETEGVPALHALEKEALLRSLQGSPAGVVAAAASVVDDAHVVRTLSGHVCVWLDLEPASSTGASHRRILSPGEDLSSRRPVFDSLADLTLSGSGDAADYAARFLHWWDGQVG